MVASRNVIIKIFNQKEIYGKIRIMRNKKANENKPILNNKGNNFSRTKVS